MFEEYEFPKFFYLGISAVLAFISLEILGGWMIVEVPYFIEVFVTFLIVISALSMIRYLLAFLLENI